MFYRLNGERVGSNPAILRGSTLTVKCFCPVDRPAENTSGNSRPITRVVLWGQAFTPARG